VKAYILVLVALLAAGCSPRPNPNFTGEHPSYEGIAKAYPKLIPAISRAGQNRSAVQQIEVLWNDELPSPDYTYVGGITSTHNPPSDINDQMIEFSKRIGMNAIVLQPPRSVRVMGVPTRVHSASVFIRN
jgi:hypothetical protein